MEYSQQEQHTIQQSLNQHLNILYCSFCHIDDRPTQRFNHLIEGTSFQICEECLQIQISKESTELKELEDHVFKIQTQLTSLDSSIHFSQSLALKEDVSKLSEQEQNLKVKQQDLINLEIEQNLKLQELKDKVLLLEREESQYWTEINKYENKLVRLEEKNIQADNDLKILHEEIERLHNINVLNDVFYIHCNEQAATINSIIIGKKLDQNSVDWDETNAGLGQLTVLMIYLHNKYGYNPKCIKFYNCLGNFSTISIYPQEGIKDKELNLYHGPGKDKLEEQKFNEAVKLLMREFRFFCEYLENHDTMVQKKIKIELPHKMQDDMIENLAIDTLSYKDQKWDKWTQVLKYFLANIKYIIERNCQHDSKAELDFIREM